MCNMHLRDKCPGKTATHVYDIFFLGGGSGGVRSGGGKAGRLYFSFFPQPVSCFLSGNNCLWQQYRTTN